MQQGGYRVGASVYDMTHRTSRGYGTISRRGEPCDDGTPRWHVHWEHPREGQRDKAIAETYLELPLVHHKERVPPAGLGQRIQVVLGTHRPALGTIVAKVG